MAIIAPYEVIKNSPVKRDYPTSYLCSIIDDYEETLIVNCFGRDFYKVLLDNVIVYTEVEEFVLGTIYQLDDEVVLDGCIFISLTNNNNDVPTDSLLWSLAPKFETTCLNNLWLRLKKYLALMIINKSVVYSTYQIGSKGVTSFDTDNSGLKTASKDGINKVNNHLIDDALTILDNLKNWVIENKTTCVAFKDIPFVKDTCGLNCDTDKRRQRRIYFRT